MTTILPMNWESIASVPTPEAAQLLLVTYAREDVLATAERKRSRMARDTNDTEEEFGQRLRDVLCAEAVRSMSAR